MKQLIKTLLTIFNTHKKQHPVAIGLFIFTITGGAGGELVGKDPDHDFFHYLKVHVKGNEVRTEVIPIATPDFEFLDRVGAMVWIYFYAFIRIHGIELAICLLMAYTLAVVFNFKNKEADK